MNYKTSKIALAALLIAFLMLSNSSVRAQQYSAGTVQVADFTNISMTLKSNITTTSSMMAKFDPAGSPNYYSLPAQSSHDVFDLQTPIRTTASISFSYRDPSGAYGCDFQYTLTYSGTSGGSDFYTDNFYATPVYAPNGTHVTCVTQTSSSQNVATGSGGAGMYAGFRIKP